ncbi:phage holin family protein [Celeribacter litoreus]|uniref:phage holin family protein n=1 Tax=Celeribacter litoreus TaxID=2876714 RepID=UPI001CCE8025|nr:phage holin family protein [Celeribacter litoreus]MCA0042240.1 phage holin family protein [Celeribacter litoreus]
MGIPLAEKAQDLARRTTLGLAGGLLLIIGLGFLTLAAWILLVDLQGTANAALIIGCVYTGAALLTLAATRVKRQPAPPPEQPSPMGLVSQAFLEGLGAGYSARGHVRK